jgi:hypothetical protein
LHDRIGVDLLATDRMLGKLVFCSRKVGISHLGVPSHRF